MTPFNSPLEAFLYWEANTPNAIFLKQPINGNLKTYTYAEAGNEIRRIANALSSYDLPERSHIALLSKNCAHWNMSDLAIMMAGHISIPIYPTLNAQSIDQILTHSESKVIIVGKLDDFEAQKSGIPENLSVISIGMYGENEGDLWEELLEKFEPATKIYTQKPEDLITIIYTSGTTGNPKGVMHTVGNFMESANTLVEVLELPQNIKLFSYLPLAHVAERLLGIVAYVVGANISFAESLETFAKNLEDTQPDVFFAVPRIWAKFQEKILETIPQKKLSILLKIPILNTILKNKLKQKLGLRNASFVCSGAAPLAASLMHWYNKIGIPIYQGYGMTEDCCVSHFNLPGHNKIGTVGKALFNVEAKLSSEGEICVKNSCLMTGYYKSPEMTKNAFTEDGFLRTGDIGEYDHDGYLSITGRVKDQFKTDKGKYISPAPLELLLSKNSNIEQICIVGTGIPQPIALVTLSEAGRAQSKSELIESFEYALSIVNPQFEKHEKIEKVVVMKEDWTVDNGFTTPTLKVKRNRIEKVHQTYYKQWFDNADKVIFE